MSNEGKEGVSGKDASSDYDERMEDVATPAPAIDLSNNVQARIQNPLHGIPRNTLMKRVENFTREKGLEDKIDLFRKGALLAQSQKGFETMAELSESEKELLRRETTHRWSQPRDLYLTVIVLFAARGLPAFLPFFFRGWDQTGSNGANLSFPQALGISQDAGNPRASVNEWIVGVINAGPYLGSSLIGCWLTDPLNHYFGRRGTLFWCGVFCTLSVIGQAVSQTWPQLLVRPSATTLKVRLNQSSSFVYT
ncbi:hypothetical protein CVT25_008506 [Psilocybe cyanescens]|uniref:Major facilitator superfamily (MFS) profile domain-containing protein n=1 Tax=Psilocybe cyanescens TaxID=93625 RepID=A0A409W0U6_PSICY|nr:hypothetical protein CVT25_008506 [Psilocybe cyanescens]